MNDAEWAQIRHFDKSEKWGDPARMSFSLVAELDSLRDYVGQPIVIHRGYDAAAKGSQHSLGLAADLHIVGISLVDAFLAASRFSFMGIGVYPWWNNPGLHLDMRDAPSRALWGGIGPRQYVALDTDFFSKYLM